MKRSTLRCGVFCLGWMVWGALLTGGEARAQQPAKAASISPGSPPSGSPTARSPYRGPRIDPQVAPASGARPLPNNVTNPRAAAPRGDTGLRTAATPNPPARPNDPPMRISPVSPADSLTPLPGEHPMMPSLRWAKAGLETFGQVDDYCCTVVKRERIDGELGVHQYLFAKVRHRPFSVYLYFLSPNNAKGQEVIYIDGQNDGRLWAHTIGVRDSIVGTISLDPRGRLAMQGNRYPITELGILNLTRRLVEVGETESQYGECEAKTYRGAKVDGRVCTCLQFTHPVPRKEFRFHLARIFVDEEMNLPIRYESYGWPTAEGKQPPLLEEYTYQNLKLNNGFTDRDFDIRNPEYKFR